MKFARNLIRALMLILASPFVVGGFAFGFVALAIKSGIGFAADAVAAMTEGAE